MSIQTLTHLSPILPLYDIYTFNIDTLHYSPHFEFIRHSLSLLSAHQKNVNLISNSAKRTADIVPALDNLGIHASFYQRIYTAGDFAHDHLRHHDDHFHAGLGERYYLIGSCKNISFLKGLNVHRSPSMTDADFILTVTGDEVLNDKDLTILLKEGIKRNLPMMCVGANTYLIQDQSKIIYGPQHVGHLYRNKGGKIYIHGSVRHEIYKKLSFDFPQKHLHMVIGHSLENDIENCIFYGFHSLLMGSAITKHELHIRVYHMRCDDMGDIIGNKGYHSPNYILLNENGYIF